MPVTPIESHEGEAQAVPCNRCKHADLAVIDRAEAPVPLPRDPRGQCTLLGKATLVAEQATRMGEMDVGSGDQLPSRPAAIPFGFAQHVMQLLAAELGHGFVHTFHLAARTLEQTMQIPPRRVLQRARAALKAAKMRREVGIEVRQCRSDQRRSAGGALALALTMAFATP